MAKKKRTKKKPARQPKPAERIAHTRDYKSGNIRDKEIRIRVRRDEHARLFAIAQEKGMGLSTYVRLRLGLDKLSLDKKQAVAK